MRSCTLGTKPEFGQWYLASKNLERTTVVAMMEQGYAAPFATSWLSDFGQDI